MWLCPVPVTQSLRAFCSLIINLSKVLISANKLMYYLPREHNLHFNWGFLENCASFCSCHPLGKNLQRLPIVNQINFKYLKPRNKALQPDPILTFLGTFFQKSTLCVLVSSKLGYSL